MIMFNIFGRLSKIISLHSKKNQSHTAHLSEDIDKNPLHIAKKTVQNDFPLYHCSGDMEKLMACIGHRDETTQHKNATQRNTTQHIATQHNTTYQL